MIVKYAIHLILILLSKHMCSWADAKYVFFYYNNYLNYKYH